MPSAVWSNVQLVYSLPSMKKGNWHRRPSVVVQLVHSISGVIGGLGLLVGLVVFDGLGLLDGLVVFGGLALLDGVVLFDGLGLLGGLGLLDGLGLMEEDPEDA